MALVHGLVWLDVWLLHIASSGFKYDLVLQLKDCRDAFSAGQGIVEENFVTFGRWDDHRDVWEEWRRNCMGMNMRPYIVRAQHYVDVQASWASWRNHDCDASLGIHVPQLVDQFFATSADPLQECLWACLRFADKGTHLHAASLPTWAQKHFLNTRLYGCRSALFWNKTSECKLFSPGCMRQQEFTADVNVIFHSDQFKVPPRGRPGDYHWTDMGVCVPGSCFGAEPEDYVVWCARGAIARPVFRWQVAEVGAPLSTGLTIQPPTASASEPFPKLAGVANTSEVALCIGGPARGVDSNTLESQLRHIVLPNAAKVVSYVSAVDVGSPDCGVTRILFRAVFGRHLVGFQCNPDQRHAEDEFKGFLKKVQGWIRHMGQPEDQVSSITKLWVNALDLEIFSVDEHHKSVEDKTTMFLRLLRNLLGKEACRNLFLGAERKQQVPFEYLCYTRSDAYFFTAFPSLSLLIGASVWIPEGLDWGGLNDRQAFGTRDAMLVYLDRYRDLVSGHLLLEIFADRARQQTWTQLPYRLNAERLLQLHVIRRSIIVRRFLPVSSIRCSSISGDGRRPCHVKSNVFGALGFRDMMELADVYNTAFAIRSGKASWVRSPRPRARRLVPSCEDWYASDYGAGVIRKAERSLPEGFLHGDKLTLAQCCDEALFGFGGFLKCWWEPFYDFARCCTQSLELSISPTATGETESKTLTKIACWRAAVSETGHFVEVCP